MVGLVHVSWGGFRWRPHLPGPWQYFIPVYTFQERPNGVDGTVIWSYIIFTDQKLLFRNKVIHFKDDTFTLSELHSVIVLISLDVK